MVGRSKVLSLVDGRGEVGCGAFWGGALYTRAQCYVLQCMHIADEDADLVRGARVLIGGCDVRGKR